MRSSGNRGWIWPVIAVAILALSGCDEPAAAPPPVLTGCEVLTWDNYGKGELRSWCTGCHSSQVTGDDRNGAPQGVNFDSRDGVVSHVDEILARATGDAPTMPPVGGGDAEDRARFAQWLECGAP